MTEHTLIFVISGMKLIHFPDQTLSIAPNSVFLLRKGIYVMAEWLEDGIDFEAMMIFLPEDILRSFLRNYRHDIKDFRSEPCVIFPENKLLRDYKLQFREYFNYQATDFKELLPLKQQEILALLCLSHRQETLAFVASAVSPDCADMPAIIAAHILTPLTTLELAQLCNRSLAAFKRDFRKHYNSSPRTYITRQRLEHARMLLQNTHKLVSEIAHDCAFENTSHFIRIFRQEFGVTPQAIRAVTVIE